MISYTTKKLVLVIALIVVVAGCDNGSDGSDDGFENSETIPFKLEFRYELFGLAHGVLPHTQYEVGISENRFEDLLSECQANSQHRDMPTYIPGRWYMAISDGGGGCGRGIELESVERSSSAAGKVDRVNTRRTKLININCARAESPSVIVYSWGPGSVEASVSEAFSVE